jgi:hypothetical protein
MADRYWVGGSGTWDATTTTNWSASSGGLGGASAPTSADNVIFNSASNATLYTVTVGTNAACADLTAAGPLSGNVTFTLGATAVINCYGSLLFLPAPTATGVTWTPTIGSAFNLLATTTGKTITTNGVSLGGTICTLDGISGAWTLGSDFTSTNNLIVFNGSFSSANFNITIASLGSSNANIRSISLGSSTLTVSASVGINLTNSTNLTFNAGTSTITSSNAAPIFNGGGQTFYNVNFTSAAAGTTTITGANTFRDLNQTSRSANGLRIFTLGANQTVSGTLTLGVANTSIRRIQVISDTVGIQRTITLNGTLATLADCDFRDIATAGTYGTWTGTRLSNGLGNGGITFTAAKDVYWNLAAGGNWSATGWALSSGGAVSTNNFPLAQDRVIIENTGLNTSATITFNSDWWVGELDMSTRSNAMTLASGTSTPRIYKNVTLSSAVTMTGTGAWNFNGQGTTQILDVNTATFVPPFLIDSPSGTLQLAENTTCSATVTLTQGTLNLNNNVLTALTFSSPSTNTRSIAFGTGNITVTGNNGTVWNTATATNFSYTGTSNVNFTYAGSTGTRTIAQAAAASGGTEANALNMNISAGSDIVTFGGSSRIYRNLNFTGFTGTYTNGLITFVGNLIFSSGMTVGSGSNIVTFGATSGTQQITTNGNTTIDFPITVNAPGATVQLQDNLTIGSTRTFTLTAGTLDLNTRVLSCANFQASNSNTRSILFGTSNITLTGNSLTILNFGTATGFTYTGTPKFIANYSGSTGSRVIQFGATGAVESNAVDLYITGGSDSVTGSGNPSFGTLDFTGFTGTFVGGGGTLFLYRNLVLGSGMTITAVTQSIVFSSTVATTQSITTNGVTVNRPISFTGTQTYQFQDALTQNSTSAFTITSGTVKLKASTTNTVGALTTTTTATKALQSTIPGTQATISQASGDVYADYITITDSAATGGANFYATAASNGGNNTGWNFATNFYYWVGGDGNWSDAANHWSNASGGSPSASYLPTAADIVFFDANSNSGTSAFNVTVDGTGVSPSLCKDFVCGLGTGGGALDGAMTLTMGVTAVLNCYGSMTLPSTNLTWTAASGSAIGFLTTTTGKTITTNGVSLTSAALIFEGGGGTGGWTLGSALTSSNFLYLNYGTFSTANYNITAGGIIRNQTVFAATINLGSSTISCSLGVAISLLPTNLTFNAGTSQINCSAASPTFAGGGLTFYNVGFVSGASGTATITGANTYNVLSFVSRSATGVRTVTLSANQTINTQLTIGTSTIATRRIKFVSDTIGTQRTVTVNGTVSALYNVDFKDIVAAGTFGTWSGTRLGDGQNNSNITFDAPKTVYWNLAGTQNWSATAWATTNNGVPDINNFPLAQDVATFTEAGAAGDITINANWFVGTIQMADGVSNRTTAFTFADSDTFTCFGNITLFSNLVWTTGDTINFQNYGNTSTFKSVGVTVPSDITQTTATGTVRIDGNLTLGTTNLYTLTQGTLDLTNGGAGNYVLSTGIFSSNNTNTRSIAFGTGNITVTGNDALVWATSNSTNLTYTGTPTVNCTYSGSTGTRTINANNANGGTETNALNFNISSGSDTIDGGLLVKNLDFTGFTGTYSNTAIVHTIYGNLKFSSGMTLTSNSNFWLFGATSGTQQITTAGQTLDFPLTFSGTQPYQFQDALTQGAGRAFTFSNGTLQFKSGTTNTVGIFTTTGTTLKYLQATIPGSQATISTADTTPVFASYLNVKDSFAAQVDFWHALFTQNNQNGGNNTNWIFNSSNNNFFMMFA